MRTSVENRTAIVPAGISNPYRWVKSAGLIAAVIKDANLPVAGSWVDLNNRVISASQITSHFEEVSVLAKGQE
jgi:hypothetical protein